MFEPIPIEFSLIETAAFSKNLKLSAITLKKQRYIFLEKFSKCMQEDYQLESERRTISDRYSIIQQVSEGIVADSLRNVTGRVCF
ncbi:MAG TPA: hypothetical protein VF602_13190 [Pedobacter sp.]|jgi:hypothetical protein